MDPSSYGRDHAPQGEYGGNDHNNQESIQDTQHAATATATQRGLGRFATKFEKRMRSKAESLKTRYWQGLHDPADNADIEDAGDDVNSGAHGRRGTTEATRRDLNRAIYYQHKTHGDTPAPSKVHKSQLDAGAASTQGDAQSPLFNASELTSMGTFLLGGVALSGVAYVASRLARSADAFAQNRFADYPHLQSESHCAQLMTDLTPFFVISPKYAQRIYKSLDYLILVWRKTTAYESSFMAWALQFQEFDTKLKKQLDARLQELHVKQKKRQQDAAARKRTRRGPLASREHGDEAGDSNSVDGTYDYDRIADSSGRDADGPDVDPMDESLESRANRAEFNQVIEIYHQEVEQYKRRRPPPLPVDLWRETANVAYLTIQSMAREYTHIAMAFNTFWSECGKYILLDPVIENANHELWLIKTRVTEHVIRTGELPRGPMDALTFCDNAPSRAVYAAGKPPPDVRLASPSTQVTTSVGADKSKPNGGKPAVAPEMVRQYLRDKAEYDARIVRFSTVFRDHFKWWMTTFARTLPSMQRVALELDILYDHVPSELHARRDAEDSDARQPDGHTASSSKTIPLMPDAQSRYDMMSRPGPKFKDKVAWVASQLLGETGNTIVNTMLGQKRERTEDDVGDGAQTRKTKKAPTARYTPVSMTSSPADKIKHAYERCRHEGIASWFSSPYAKYDHMDSTLPVDELSIQILSTHLRDLVKIADMMRSVVSHVINDANLHLKRTHRAGDYPTQFNARMAQLNDKLVYGDVPHNDTESVHRP